MRMEWETEYRDSERIRNKRQQERDVPYRPADGEWPGGRKLLRAAGPLEAPQSRCKPHDLCFALPAGPTAQLMLSLRVFK